MTDHAMSPLGPVGSMFPAASRALVQEALADPAVETVETDGAHVWITGCPAAVRADLRRRVWPPAEGGAGGE